MPPTRLIMALLVFSIPGLSLAEFYNVGYDGGMMGGGMMMNRPPGDTGRPLPDKQSKDAQLYGRYCGQCHAPPLPSVHSAGEWTRVVARMKQYMATQSKAIPDDAELGRIMGYLQRHAR